jgi:cytochrome b561
VNPRYTVGAVLLHWLMALGLLVNLALGLYMVELLLSPLKLRLYAWHKWLGISLLALVLVRLAWRGLYPPPAAPAALSALERRLAALGHGALYSLMLAVPLAGWLFSSAKGFSVVLFGVLPLPDLIAKNAQWAEILAEVHATLAITLLLLIVIHILAAVKHQFWDRIPLLQRMWLGSMTHD